MIIVDYFFDNRNFLWGKGVGIRIRGIKENFKVLE